MVEMDIPDFVFSVVRGCNTEEVCGATGLFVHYVQRSNCVTTVFG